MHRCTHTPSVSLGWADAEGRRERKRNPVSQASSNDVLGLTSNSSNHSDTSGCRIDPHVSRSSAGLGPHSVKEGPNTIVHSVCVKGRGGTLVTKSIFGGGQGFRELGDLRRIHHPAPMTASLEVVDAATQVIDRKHRFSSQATNFRKQ